MPASELCHSAKRSILSTVTPVCDSRDSTDHNMNILLVDDQKPLRWTIKEMLQRKGFQSLTETDDGDVAQEKLKINIADLMG